MSPELSWLLPYKMYLYFEKCPSHLGPPETSLVFLGSVCPQLKPGPAAESSWGEGGGRARLSAALGLDASLLCTGGMNSNPG